MYFVFQLLSLKVFCILKHGAIGGLDLPKGRELKEEKRFCILSHLSKVIDKSKNVFCNFVIEILFESILYNTAQKPLQAIQPLSHVECTAVVKASDNKGKSGGSVSGMRVGLS